MRFIYEISPDLNLTPLATFLRFLPSAARQKKRKKKQQELSGLNRDYLRCLSFQNMN